MDRSWMDDAACLGIDVEVFFPSQALQTIPGAITGKTICDGCDVRKKCLDYALETGQKKGIWGGTSGNERLKMRGMKEDASEVS